MKKVMYATVFVVSFAVVLFLVNPIDFTYVKKALTTITDTGVTKENEELKKQIVNLTQQKSKAELLEHENKELRQLLDINNSKNYEEIFANVVGVTYSTKNFLTIDKGASHGIKPGNVAVFGNALVGRVSAVFDTSAQVIPITAPDISVGAVMSRTGATGYTESSRQGFFENSISLTLFGAEDFAAAGDKILTSGLGTVFPKGLLIGSVTDSTNKKSSKATLRTAVDMFSLSAVCILSEVE